MSIPQPANPQSSPSESPYPRRFAGRVVIVTGAAGGIGRAAARRFAAEGAAIVAVDLPGSDLEGTAAAVAAVDGASTAVTADVRSEDDVAAYVAAALDAYGKVDALFNNAGVEGPVVPLVDYPADDFDRVMAVNVRGVWLGIKHAGPAIAASGGGAIVSTASLAGMTGTARLCAYGASKHAVIGLTKTAALEFRPSRCTGQRRGAGAHRHPHGARHRSGHEPRRSIRREGAHGGPGAARPLRHPGGGRRGRGIPLQRRRRLHDGRDCPRRRRPASRRLERSPDSRAGAGDHVELSTGDASRTH